MDDVVQRCRRQASRELGDRQGAERGYSVGRRQQAVAYWRAREPAGDRLPTASRPGPPSKSACRAVSSARPSATCSSAGSASRDFSIIRASHSITMPPSERCGDPSSAGRNTTARSPCAARRSRRSSTRCVSPPSSPASIRTPICCTPSRPPSRSQVPSRCRAPCCQPPQRNGRRLRPSHPHGVGRGHTDETQKKYRSVFYLWPQSPKPKAQSLTIALCVLLPPS